MQKKLYRFFSLLMAVCMVLSMFPAQAFAEGEEAQGGEQPCAHEFADGVCVFCEYACPHEAVCYEEIPWDDEEAAVHHRVHCDICGAEFYQEHEFYSPLCEKCGYECRHEGARYEYSDPVSHNMICDVCQNYFASNHTFVDGVCPVCEYVCEHIFHHYEEIGNDFHVMICACCDVEIPAEKHTYIDGFCYDCWGWCTHDEWADGVCTNCGYECRHEGARYEHYDPNSHLLPCHVCHEQILSEHTFMDGVCLVCEYVCEHELHWYDVIDNDFHVMVCFCCDVVEFPAEKHTYFNGLCSVCWGWCTHDKWADGVCTSCGSKCPHENCEYKADGDHHNLVCVNCNTTVKTEQHRFADGACTVCGWQSCLHENGFFEFNSEYHRAVCPDCGAMAPWVEHEFVDGVCVFCEYACPHENVWYEDEGNADHHTVHCADCFAVYSLGHEFYSCVCVFCNYACPHENCSYRIERDYHELVCDVCYQIVITAEHEFKDGICTVCEYACPHEYIVYREIGEAAYHLSICDICGAEFYQEHEFHNPLCEKCGYECRHEGARCEHCDMNGHLLHCNVCNEPIFSDHTFMDGVCLVCEYVCEHESPWYDRIDNDFHVMVCDCCDAEIPAEKHTYIDGRCSVCWGWCTHDKWADGVCTNCGSVCGHTEDETGRCTVCGEWVSFTELTITAQPQAVSSGAGKNVTFTVAAQGTGLTYQWQFKSPTGSWCKTAAEGAATDTLVIPVTAGRDGCQYRCVITDAVGTKLTSDPAALTVVLPAFTGQPADETKIEGDNAIFVVDANMEVTYQWQFRTPDGTWAKTTASGYDSFFLRVPATMGRNGCEYRCVITDAAGNKAYSDPAVLTVLRLLTEQPRNVAAPAGSNAVFTVASDLEEITYRWEYRELYHDWVSVEGADTNQLTINAVPELDGCEFRCVIARNDSDMEYRSNSAVLTVLAFAITGQPEDVAAYAGENAVFTVETSAPMRAYQWQFKSPTGSWAKTGAEGANTDTLTVPVTASRDGYQYRCIVTDAGGHKLTSEPAALTVLTFAITAQPEDVSVTGGNAVFTVAASGANLTYQWQFKSPTGTWCKTTAEGANTDTLTVPATVGRNGYQYRCLVTDDTGRKICSDPAVLTIVSFAITANPESVTAPRGGSAEFHVTATGSGLTYQWQFMNPATGSWCKTTAEGAATDTLVIPATTGRNGYQYRCIITSSSGKKLTTTPAALTVQ